MRITTGKLKGRAINCGTDGSARPTLTRVREACFSMIFDGILGASFLDLFAGTGIMGLEAFSRGAGRVIFVDNNRHGVLRENAARLDAGEVHITDALSYLRQTAYVFDYIYIDPPWADVTDEYLRQIAAVILSRGLLSENGLVILECENDYELVGFTTSKRKIYGRVILKILKITEGFDEKGSLSGQL